MRYLIAALLWTTSIFALYQIWKFITGCLGTLLFGIIAFVIVKAGVKFHLAKSMKQD